MATLYPFRALRPAPDTAASIAAVPYDVVNTDEARALAEGNPLSFLRVSRAEIELPSGTDPYSDAVYDRAAKNFAAPSKSRLFIARTAWLISFESTATAGGLGMEFSGFLSGSVSGLAVGTSTCAR